MDCVHKTKYQKEVPGCLVRQPPCPHRASSLEREGDIHPRTTHASEQADRKAHRGGFLEKRRLLLSLKEEQGQVGSVKVGSTGEEGRPQDRSKC
jgi:hypothetical protein